MLNNVKDFGKKMMVAAINCAKRWAFNCKFMIADRHRIPWMDVDCITDAFYGVHADIDQRITIKRTGGFILKKYVITIYGKDANTGSLPNGAPREFDVTYDITSLHSIEHLCKLIDGATAIGMKEYGSRALLKVQSEDGTRYAINKAMVTGVTSNYVTISNRLDLMKTRFKAPRIVELKESALCECVS